MSMRLGTLTAKKLVSRYWICRHVEHVDCVDCRESRSVCTLPGDDRAWFAVVAVGGVGGVLGKRGTL